MRDQGLFISNYPTVIGFDVSGLVIAAGNNVPMCATDNVSGIWFRSGITRVAAYAVFFWNSCDPNYGAFQERFIMPWQHALPLPDEGLSWNQAATLPVAFEVPLNAWDSMGFLRVGEAPALSLSAARFGVEIRGETQNCEKQGREALIIWGASSSVGTMGVQTARLLRDDHNSPFAAVYATASLANHEYIVSLGADSVFDYKDPQVVDEIISAAREDGLVI